MALALLALLGGLAVLAIAADQFVLGAARVALLRRVPPLAVGVVVIGFGTSTPELLVSILAATSGDPAVAVGNVVGSNIANLTLLLGIGAMLVPLQVDSRTVRREAVQVVVATAVFALVVRGGGISRPEGLVLLGLMAASVVAVLRRAPAGSTQDPVAADVSELAAAAEHRLPVEAARTILGLLLTVGSAQVLLSAALAVAEIAGLSQSLVGATLVAVGTSLPELVTVVQSARRRETDLIVGNLLGSNIFNALAVGGATGLVGLVGVDAPELTSTAAGSAVAVAALAALLMRTGHVVTRLEGALLIAVYGGAVAALA